MINRYLIQEVDSIWKEENKLNLWKEIEILVCEGWGNLSVIPKKDIKKIRENAKVDIERMLEIEKETKHDVVAFTRMLSESLGDEKKWIHLGLTSTDVVDTAQNFLIKESNKILLSELEILKESLKVKAIKYKETLITGRTHGIYGEPTSLGLKFLLWFDEIKRQIERLTLARKQIEVAKISGSMGNYAHLELSIEEYVAGKLGLGLDNISTQVTQRDRHAFLISVFGNISSTLEKISTEIRLFQRSEVQEMLEGFSEKQKGSSSMPHKKNPISSENITGLSRYIRSFVNMSFENNILWHERDISHSSNERITFPDIFNSLIYIVRRLNAVICDIFVNEKVIIKHLNEQNQIYFSQNVLTYIIKKDSNSREEIYDFIQECTLEAQKTKEDFKVVLEKKGIDKYIKDKKEFDSLFDNNYFLRNVEGIFKRVIYGN